MKSDPLRFSDYRNFYIIGLNPKSLVCYATVRTDKSRLTKISVKVSHFLYLSYLFYSSATIVQRSNDYLYRYRIAKQIAKPSFRLINGHSCLGGLRPLLNSTYLVWQFDIRELIGRIVLRLFRRIGCFGFCYLAALTV